MPVPGSSLRLDNADLTRSLLTLIRRELPFQRQAGGAAIPPRWVPVRTAQGVLRALVFPINRKSAAYIGGLTEKAVVASLATSAGEAGSMAEYLRSTVQHLEDMGIWRTWASATAFCGGCRNWSRRRLRSFDRRRRSRRKSRGRYPQTPGIFRNR